MKIANCAFILGIFFIPQLSSATNELHKAIRNGNSQQALKLIELHSYHQEKPFWTQAWSHLFEVGSYLNDKDEAGNTALINACFRGDEPIVQALIQAGADVNLVGQLGVSPLIASASFGNLEQAKMLLDAGARIEARDVFGKSPFLYSISKGHSSMIDFWATTLENLCLDVDSKGNTPLMIAAEKDDLSSITKLLQLQCQLDVRNHFGETAIYKAALVGSDRAVQALIEAGADLSLPYGKERIPLSEVLSDEIYPIAIQLTLEKLGETHLPQYAIFLLLSRDGSNFRNLIENQIAELINSSRSFAELKELKSVLAKSEITLESTTATYLNRKLKTLFLPILKERISFFEMFLNREKTVLPEATVDHEEISTSSLNQESLKCKSCHCVFPKEEWRPGSGPAGCDCPLHDECASTYANFLVTNSGERQPRCIFGCGLPIQSSFLQRFGISEEMISEFELNQMALRLAQINGWTFCPTADCLNGALAFTHSAVTFQCDLCDLKQCLVCKNKHSAGTDCGTAALNEKNELESKEFINKLLKEGKLAGGKFRPCYYCGILTERLDGCNQMTCTRCTRKWDWNKGPQGINGDFTTGPMQYRSLVPAHL
ncbi:MAG: ankyrin repeat domain-containing protein [Bdellovibrionia bacterium]